MGRLETAQEGMRSHVSAFIASMRRT